MRQSSTRIVAAAAALFVAGCAREGEERTAEAAQAAAEGQTCVTIQRGGEGGVEDTKLREDVPDENAGARDTFVTGDQFTRRIALLRFDLGPIPPGMIIDSAVATLSEVQSLGPSSIDVHAATAAWDEGTVTWNSFGASYDPAVALSFSNGGEGHTGAVSFDMTGLVESWYGGAPNHGAALLAATNTTWASSEKADPALRPSLEVCYSPPSCSDGIQNQGETGVDCGGPCASCPGTCQAPGANLVQNGSLELLGGSFVNTSGNYMALGAGNTAIAGWTVAPTTSGSIVWGRTPTVDGFTAANGALFVDLTGFGAGSPNGALQQTIALSAGVPHTFSMAVASFNNGVVSVTIGSHTLSLTPGAPFSVGGTSWRRLTGTIVGDPLEPTPLLRVMNATPGSTIVFIDDIAVRCGG